MIRGNLYVKTAFSNKGTCLHANGRKGEYDNCSPG